MRKVDPAAAKTFKGTRFVLLKNPENLTDTQTVQMAAIKRSGGRIWRAYQLKEGLRAIYADHDAAPVIMRRRSTRSLPSAGLAPSFSA